MEPGDPLDIRLIKAGIDLFGLHGFDSTSTRAIAVAAGAQMSAITYHFGGKDGLYLACARYIAEQMRDRLAPALAASDAQQHDDDGAAAASQAIMVLIGGIVTVMMRDEAALIARFVIREQMNPTPAFTTLYEGVMGDVVARVSGLLQRICPQPLAGEAARVRAMALLGQVFSFRFARATLMAATGWEATGDRETDIVRAIVLDHSSAILAALERGGGA
jgi:AcrR family transcriptional regulator